LGIALNVSLSVSYDEASFIPPHIGAISL